MCLQVQHKQAIHVCEWPARLWRVMKDEEWVLLGQHSPTPGRLPGIPGLPSLTPGTPSKSLWNPHEHLHKFPNCPWGWSCHRWELRLYWMFKKKKKTLALQTQGKLLSAGWANGKWDRTLKMYLITEWYLRVEGEMGSRKNDILWMKNEYFQEGGLKEDLLLCSYNPARFSFNILP